MANNRFSTLLFSNFAARSCGGFTYFEACLLCHLKFTVIDIHLVQLQPFSKKIFISLSCHCVCFSSHEASLFETGGKGSVCKVNKVKTAKYTTVTVLILHVIVLVLLNKAYK